MIISPQFIWIHLPKTGGTSTARLFRQLAVPGIRVDAEDVDSKHESIAEREQRTGEDLAGRRLFATIRRLPAWLLSDWHHKTRFMQLELPFEPVQSGLFYSLRLGGVWVAADYWLRYFHINQDTTLIRLEHLEADANQYIGPYLSRADSEPTQLRFPQANVNQYTRSPEQFFSAADLQTIHQNNPLWSAMEARAYASDSRHQPGA